MYVVCVQWHARGLGRPQEGVGSLGTETSFQALIYSLIHLFLTRKREKRGEEREGEGETKNKKDREKTKQFKEEKM